jgi:C-terminal processing protease CtpA/Prc
MFSSSLQGYKRATVVGETTGGGAHGIRPFSIAQGFTAFIPFERHYHPLTYYCWERVGVLPDIPCSSEDALKVAQINILKEQQNTPGYDPKINDYLEKLETERNE